MNKNRRQTKEGQGYPDLFCFYNRMFFNFFFLEGHPTCFRVSTALRMKNCDGVQSAQQKHGFHTEGADICICSV